MGSELKEVAKGGALSLLGNALNYALRLVAGIIVIRLITKSDYGLLSLGYVLISLAALFSGLGFGNGVPRFISKYSETKDKDLIGEIVGSSLFATGVASMGLSVLVFLTAGTIANRLSKPDMVYVLKVLAFMIPPIAMMGNLTAIFRGFKKIKPKIIFQNLAVHLIKLLLLLVFIAIGLRFKGVLLAYVGSIWLAFAFYVGYTIRNLRHEAALRINTKLVRELVVFSVPLLGLVLINKLMSWTATLTLGYLHTSEAVGLYNAPTRLTALLPVPLSGLLFLYLPVATELFEKGKGSDLGKLYVSVTKWGFLLTLPFLLFLLLDSEFVLSFVFGEEYLVSANVLRILAIAFSINTFLGPNAATLVASGTTMEVFWSSVAGALTAIGLCIILVTDLGALGAAIGTATGIVTSNVFRSIALFLKYRIHPISWQYIRPVLLTSVLSVLFLLAAGTTSHPLPFIHILFLLIIFLISMISPFLTRSIDTADLLALKSIESRIHRKTLLTDRLNGWLDLDEQE